MKNYNNLSNGKKNFPFIVFLFLLLFLPFATVLDGKTSIKHKNSKPLKSDVLFSDLFREIQEINLDYGKHIVYSVIEVRVDKKGHFIITDYLGKQVVVFDENGKFLKVMAKEGRGPGEVMLPAAIDIDEKDNIYISDYALRRISIFSPEYKFKDSFIFRSIHEQPHWMRVYSGYIFMAAANTVSANPEPGEYIWRKRPLLLNKYDVSGNFIKSFFPVYSGYVGTVLADDDCYFDVYRDSIYAVEKSLYKIYVFDLEGKLCRTFGNPPKYFKQVSKRKVPSIKKSHTLSKKQRMEFDNSFSKIPRLFVMRNYLILEILMPPKSMDEEWEFSRQVYKIDIFKLAGTFLVSNIPVGQYEIKCVDARGNIYFLKEWDYGDDTHPPKYVFGKYRLNTKLLQQIERSSK